MPTRNNHGERLAAVETELQGLRAEVGEMRIDVKTLVAAHNRQSGAAKLAGLLWAGLVALGGVLGGLAMGGKAHP